MAEAVVSFVVERIGDLLIQEGRFLGGVSVKVDQMKTELQRMQRFLKDADKRQDQDEVVRGWVSEIRDLAYEVENVIETFVLEIASRREKGFSKKFKRYATIFIEVVKIHKLGNQIEAIQAKITDLSTSLQTYGIHQLQPGSSSTSMQQKLRRSYPHLVEEHTIGLDNAIKVVVTKLLAKETDVVFICGMGGLGKTTLANKLFHHDEVKDHFDALAWYCVSQQFQAREVWEGILIKLDSPSTRDEISKMKDDEIVEELYRVQQTKKCLVVLDDIWERDAWDLLKPAFPIGKTGGGSKIIMTSRNKVVDATSAFIYDLQTLNEDESWELFLLAIGFKFNMDMEKLGMEMVKKCGGLPLAIRVLGGLLATKNSVSKWENVHKNVEFHLRNKGTDKKYSVVNEVLALSYNELPYQVKSCFLHLGNFPEDYEIPCKTLFRMWAAEGFGSQCQHVEEGNETMEDIVERYLHDLIDRSIVQVSRMGSTGRVKTCRLHDLMRDFCLLKANEENYLAIVRTTNLKEKPNINKVYRLGVHGNSYDIDCYGRFPNLRSLLFFENRMRYDDFTSTVIASTFNAIKLLRILIIEGGRIPNNIPIEIGGLVHLRYLAFEGIDLSGVPSSIGNLRYLQTLIIRPGNITIWTEVPNVVWKLEELRHLILGYGCIIKRDEGLKLGNTRKMQTLELGYPIVLYDVVGVLVKSSQLKKLKLYFKLNEDLGEIPSGCLQNLTSLSIITWFPVWEILLSSCHQLLKLCYCGILEKLPEWQHFPPNLTKLTLMSCKLEEDPMPILEKLPNLCILRLSISSFYGRSLVCSSKGFPKLQTLLLHQLPLLEEWRVEEAAMPNLSQLHIERCKELKMIPEGIKFITTLRQLEIELMPKEFEDRVRGDVDGREGDDFYKVHHVPSIIIRDTLTF